MRRCITERAGFAAALGFTVVLAISIIAPALDPGEAATTISPLLAWVDRLESANLAVRLEGAYSLPGIDLDSERTTRDLIGLLRHEDPFVRRSAASALGEITEASNLVVVALIEALKDDVTEVRNHAAVALAKVGSLVVPALVQQLKEISTTIAPFAEWSDTTRSSLREIESVLFALTMTQASVVPNLMEAVREMLSPDFVSVTFAERPTLAHCVTFIAAERGRSSVANLVSYLVDEDVSLRALSLIALGRIGAGAADAAPKIAVIANAEASLSRLATRVLGMIGPKAQSHLTDLLRDHPDPAVRAEATEWLDADNPACISGLAVALATDQYVVVRAAAAAALRKAVIDVKRATWADADERDRRLTEFPLGTLVAALDDPDSSVQEGAASALRELIVSPHPTVLASLPDLIDALRSPNTKIQRDIACALGRVGPAAMEAAPRLIELLQEADAGNPATFPDPRTSFIEALGHIGEGNPDVLTTLVAMFSDPARGQFDYAVIDALGNLGPAAEPVVPLLSQRLRTICDLWKQKRIASALARIQPTGVTALLDIVRCADADDALRETICEALEGLIVEDERVFSTFLEMSYSANRSMRLCAAHSLASAGVAAGSVLAILEDIMLESNGTPCWKVLRSLKALGPDAVPTILSLFECHEVPCRGDLVDVLSEVGHDDPRVVSAMIHGLDDPDPVVRKRSAARLGEQTPCYASEAIAALTSLLVRELGPDTDFYDSEWDGLERAKDTSIVAAVFYTLQRFGPYAVDVVPQLGELVDHEDPFIRARVIHTLGCVGPVAKSEAAVIVARLADDVRTVRTAAANALIQMGVDIDDLGPALYTIAIDDYVAHVVASVSWRAHDYFLWMATPRIAYCIRVDLAERFPSGLPPFPWPPPCYAHIAAFEQQRVDFPRNLLGDDETTLGTVCNRLSAALFCVDPIFEGSLFGAPGGFVFLTKTERIRPDGTPLPAEHRWTMGKVPPLSLADYIGRLFFEKPGFFRTIAFVVTTKRITEFSDTPLTDISEGAADLPDEIANETLAGTNCYVLVYSFERRQGKESKMFKSLSAYVHFEKSGIRSALAGLT